MKLTATLAGICFHRISRPQNTFSPIAVKSSVENEFVSVIFYNIFLSICTQLCHEQSCLARLWQIENRTATRGFMSKVHNTRQRKQSKEIRIIKCCLSRRQPQTRIPRPSEDKWLWEYEQQNVFFFSMWFPSQINTSHSITPWNFNITSFLYSWWANANAD